MSALTDQVEVLVDVAVLGKQVQEFCASDVGKFMLSCADVEVQRGLAKLKVVDHTDANAIRLAQAQVWRGESFRGWLEQVVLEGLKAEEVLADREE